MCNQGRCSSLKPLTALSIGNKAAKVKTTFASFDKRFYDNFVKKTT